MQRFGEVMAGGYRAMLRLREERVVRAIGAGINEIQACEDFARAGDFDCFLLAGRYTLLEQAALDTLLPYCAEQRHLAADRRPLQYRHSRDRAPFQGAYYNYAPAPAEILERRGQDRGGVPAPRRQVSPAPRCSSRSATRTSPR